MADEIKQHVNSQCVYLKRKKPHLRPKTQFQAIETTKPLELIAVDYLHLQKGIGGYEYILLIVDYFTRFAQTCATRNKSATTTAKKIYKDYILRFGIPRRILHDQGKEFENCLFHQLQLLCHMTRSRTTPYHPQCNGAVERMNCTLLRMLSTIPDAVKMKWPAFQLSCIFCSQCN